PGRGQGAARLHRLQPQPAFVDLRPDADADRRRPPGAGAVLVRQRVGLLQPHGRYRRGDGEVGVVAQDVAWVRAKPVTHRLCRPTVRYAVTRYTSPTYTRC